ncbi:MAG: glycosyltransferase [Firmicutes bacterium]|nr:glycosyltransferase [Bacillota bacterium]
MHKIKVLQINKLYYPVTGGVERVVQQIAEGLNACTDMKVLVCQKKGKRAIEAVNGVEVHRAGSLGILFSTPVSFDFFRQFQRLKKDRDILHIHMPFPLADAAVALFGFQGKIILWWHSDVVRQKLLLMFYRPLLHKLLKRADLIIVATQGHIDGSDYLAAYREKCAVIPFGVDPMVLARYDPIGAAPCPPAAPVRFLFVGRLIYYKGCNVLLEAFSHVKGAELELIGDGSLEKSLKEQAARLGLEDKVIWRGHVSDEELAKAFTGCDVFVLPSVEKSEAFGLVQIEAMACGKPVINTALPSGVPYVSLDGVTGFTVPPGDAAALSAAMQKLVDSPCLRKQFGMAAFRRAQEEYSISKMLGRVMEQYEKLAGQGERA